MTDPDPIQSMHDIARKIEESEKQALVDETDKATGGFVKASETYIIGNGFADTIYPIRANLNNIFVPVWEAVQADVQVSNVAHGWSEPDLHDAIRIALLHSELSEALEGLRMGNPPSDHIPEFSSLEEELADVVIRIMDIAALRKLRIAEAILAKHEFNRTRPFKHGGKCF